jgi:hypothetical protein
VLSNDGQMPGIMNTGSLLHRPHHAQQRCGPDCLFGHAPGWLGLRYPLVALGYSLPALLKIQPAYMENIFNQQIFRRYGVPFHAVVGTHLIDAISSPCASVPSDTVVAIDRGAFLTFEVQPGKEQILDARWNIAFQAGLEIVLVLVIVIMLRRRKKHDSP